jgi:hypothetical protein
MRALLHVGNAVVAAPLHTTSLERTFSASGRMWSDERGRLDADRAEMLTLMKALVAVEAHG